MGHAPVNPEEPHGSVLLRAQNLSGRSGIVHGFTTRRGGVSEGPLATLNLAARPDETAERLAENWRRVAQALDPTLGPDAVVLLHQVHGGRVVRVDGPSGPHATAAEADAAYTTDRGVVLAVRVADCVPVLVAGPGVVGVAHAGWRGVVAGVVPALIDALNGVADGPLAAAVGPCISGAAFEVGPEVVDGLRAAGLPDDAFLLPPGPRGRPHVDLRRAVARQLADAGVDSVEDVARCTATDPDLFSHRRDGPACGRSAGVVARMW